MIENSIISIQEINISTLKKKEDKKIDTVITR